MLKFGALRHLTHAQSGPKRGMAKQLEWYVFASILTKHILDVAEHCPPLTNIVGQQHSLNNLGNAVEPEYLIMGKAYVRRYVDGSYNISSTYLITSWKNVQVGVAISHDSYPNYYTVVVKPYIPRTCKGKFSVPFIIQIIPDLQSLYRVYLDPSVKNTWVHLLTWLHQTFQRHQFKRTHLEAGLIWTKKNWFCHIQFNLINLSLRQ